MKYIIDAKLFNAVNACAAVVDDFRYYLNTFFIDAERSQIVGSNGHIMAIAPVELVAGQRDFEMVDAGQYASLEPHQAPRNGKTHGWLYQAFRKPLIKSEDKLVLDTSNTLAGVRQYKLEPVNGAFPDYQRVKADNGKGSAIPTIGLDSFYLARVAKWAHQETGRCVLTFKSERDTIEVRYPKLPDLHITLMPCLI